MLAQGMPEHPADLRHAAHAVDLVHQFARAAHRSTAISSAAFLAAVENKLHVKLADRCCFPEHLGLQIGARWPMSLPGSPSRRARTSGGRAAARGPDGMWMTGSVLMGWSGWSWSGSAHSRGNNGIRVCRSDAADTW